MNATLECDSIQGHNNAYQWQFNSTDLTSATADTPILEITQVDVNVAGTYTCVITNQLGSDSVTTSLYVFPYFVRQPFSNLTTNGSYISLLCEVEAFPAPIIQWGRAGGQQIRDEIINNIETLTFNPVLYEDSGSYYCEAFSLGNSIRAYATIAGIIIINILLKTNLPYSYLQFSHLLFSCLQTNHTMLGMMSPLSVLVKEVLTILTSGKSMAQTLKEPRHQY